MENVLLKPIIQNENHKEVESIQDIIRLAETAIYALAETVPMDWKKIQERLDFFKNVEIELKTNDYSSLFWAEWIEKLGQVAPLVRRDIENNLQSGGIAGKNLYNYVTGMGAKLKAVQNGLCAAATIETKCEDCYFSQICPMKK